MAYRTFVSFFAIPIATLTAAGLTLALDSTGSPAHAQSLSGSWSGGGVVVFPSGERERARCRATFSSRGGRSYSMNAVCATPSTRVVQRAEVTQLTSTRYSGEFYNTEFGIAGSIRITVEGRRLSASLSGGGGTASFSLSR